MRYIAIVEQSEGIFGVTFPGLDGVVAVGKNLDEALSNAQDALSDAAAEAARDGVSLPSPPDLGGVVVPPGCWVTTILLVEETGKPARLNLSLDSGTIAAIEQAASARGLTKTAYIKRLVKAAAALGA